MKLLAALVIVQGLGGCASPVKELCGAEFDLEAAHTTEEFFDLSGWNRNRGDIRVELQLLGDQAEGESSLRVRVRAITGSGPQTRTAFDKTIEPKCDDVLWQLWPLAGGRYSVGIVPASSRHLRVVVEVLEGDAHLDQGRVVLSGTRDIALHGHPSS